MVIVVDFESHCEMPWTITAEQEGVVQAAVCCKTLEDTRLRFDLLLIELGLNLWTPTVEEDGFLIY